MFLKKLSLHSSQQEGKINFHSFGKWSVSEQLLLCNDANGVTDGKSNSTWKNANTFHILIICKLSIVYSFYKIAKMADFKAIMILI